jgi:hypothetical protein
MAHRDPASTSKKKPEEALDPLDLLERGSKILFGSFEVTHGFQMPIAETGHAIANGKMPPVCLPVLAAIAATVHPKDYNMRPAREAAWALWFRLGGTPETLAAGEDESETAEAVRDVVLLTIGYQLPFAPMDDDLQLLRSLEHLDQRFFATTTAFELVDKPNEDFVPHLRSAVDADPSASLLWLDEAVSTMRGNRRRQNQCARKLESFLEDPKSARQLATMLDMSREHIRTKAVTALWKDAPTARDRAVLRAFNHYFVMTYRQLRGIELLKQWLPRLARAVSKGSS